MDRPININRRDILKNSVILLGGLFVAGRAWAQTTSTVPGTTSSVPGTTPGTPAAPPPDPLRDPSRRPDDPFMSNRYTTFYGNSYGNGYFNPGIYGMNQAYGTSGGYYGTGYYGVGYYGGSIIRQ